LVEGNLHRRFPGHIEDGVTFGIILDRVKNAGSTDPLSALQSQLPALRDFNDFAATFHHETAGIALRDDVTDGELQVYGRKALAFVHLGTMAS